MSLLNPEHIVGWCALLFVAGFLPPFLLPTSQKRLSTLLSLGCAGLGGAVAAATAFRAWDQAAPMDIFSLQLLSLPNGFPEIALTAYWDPLTTFFMMITGCSILLVSLYSVEWLRTVTDQHIVAAVYNLFALCTVFTILMNNVYFYLFFLEAMTLSFSYLMLYRHNRLVSSTESSAEEIEISKTAFKSYLIFNHIGVMLIGAGLLVLAADAGSFDFNVLRRVEQTHLTFASPSLVFVLTLLGFGIKAGMSPTHVWVSMVHPQSPTNIHAMMSGIILKVAGIYGMLRVFFDFLDPFVEWWWGGTVLLLAGLTAIVGVFYALLGQDLKTALASHSVENVGIILAGLGMALIFSSREFADRQNFAGLASLALIASLYHTLNHAVFKSLLFFCTGSVENRTGTVRFRDLDGLMHYYPWTANAFLVGAISISGFPPFNGFVSEWLTLQAMFSGMNLFVTATRLPLLMMLVLALFLLGSAFGLTALAFVKILGEVFLGPPRNMEVMRSARMGDVPWSMRSVLVSLALLCLLLGIFPSFVTRQLSRITESLVVVSEASEIPYSMDFGTGVSMSVQEEAGEMPGEPIYRTRLSERVLMVLGLVILLPVVWLALWWKLGGRSPASTGPIWTGGIHYNPRNMQFTGTALSSLIWGSFRQRRQVKKDSSTSHLSYRLWLTRGFFVPEVFRQAYEWLVDRLLHGSQWVGSRFQNGDVRRYLWYIFVAFVLVLAALYLMAQGNGR